MLGESIKKRQQMQIATKLGYWEKQPAIILMASVPRSANKDKRYVIFLNDIWRYSEDFYERLTPEMPPTFEGFIMAKCLDLFELFDLGTPTPRQLAQVAWLIQDSIDRLKDMPPYQEEKKAIGEMEMTINGTKVEAEVKE
jgi:hypothetical protein